MAKLNERATGELDLTAVEEGTRYRFDINEYTNIVDNGKKRAQSTSTLNRGFFILVLIVVIALVITVAVFVSSFYNDSEGTLRPPTDTESIFPPIILADPQEDEEDGLDTEDANIDTVETIRTSVVTVTGYYDEITDTKTASGVILSDDGYIVTVYEVVEGASLITIVLDNGDVYTAKTIGFDTKTGIAVLDIEVDNLTRAMFFSGKNTVVAENLTIIGSPREDEIAGGSGVQKAIVSAVDREVKTAIGYTTECIEIDVIPNEYNKGAPAINSDSQMIGIIIGYGESSGYLLYGEEIARVSNAIINGDVLQGRVTVGADLVEISGVAAEQYTLPEGLMITEIDEESALFRAGADIGDIITEVDGVAVKTVAKLNEEISDHDMGNPVTLTVYSRNQNGSYSTLQLSIILSS